MLYEVKIYDCKGKLVNTISSADLDKRSTNYVRAQLTERDKNHIMSLEEDSQTPAMSSYYMVA